MFASKYGHYPCCKSNLNVNLTFCTWTVNGVVPLYSELQFVILVIGKSSHQCDFISLTSSNRQQLVTAGNYK